MQKARKMSKTTFEQLTGLHQRAGARINMEDTQAFLPNSNIIPKGASSILSPIDTVITVRPTEFVARDKFKQGGTLKLYGFWGDFEKWYLDMVERLAHPVETTLYCQTLLQDSTDDAIIAELGGSAKAETSLGEIWDLLKRQPNGEDGVLVTNNRSANVFFVIGKDGRLQAVSAFCRVDGWTLASFRIGSLFKREAGNQVFSRNP